MCTHVCTQILVSKNAGRYRFQSASLESLWLVAEDLIRRLTAFFATTAREVTPSTPPSYLALPLGERDGGGARKGAEGGRERAL